MLDVESHLSRLTELYSIIKKIFTIDRFCNMLLPVQLSIWIIFLFAFEEDISTPFVTIVDETSVKNVVFEFKYLTFEK